MRKVRNYISIHVNYSIENRSGDVTVVYVLEPVNECTKTVLFVTFIIRASLVDPPHPGTPVWARLPV